MRILTVLLLLSIFAINGSLQAQEPKKQDLAAVGGTRVSLKPPDGFTPSPQFPGYVLESFSSSNKITIDNLNGYEIVSKGADKASGQPMVVYQVILFEEQSYFLIQGLVSERNRQPNLEIFKQMARTFRRKKQ